MGEVIPFPVQNSETSKGELDAHFESEVEAANAVEQEIKKNRTWLEKRYPHWFMSPGEVVSFLEEIREVGNDNNLAQKTAA